MELLVAIILFGSVAVLGVVAIKNGRTRKGWVQALRALADEHEGLRYREGGSSGACVMGETDGVTVIVDSYTTGSGKSKTTWTRWRLTDVRGLPRGTWLQEEGVLAFFGKALTGNDLQLGDPPFDDRVLVKGPPSLRAHLDEPARAHILRAIRREWWVEDGEWTFRRNGLTTDVAVLQQVLADGLDLCRGLRRPGTDVERLAAIVRDDPVPGVRLRALQTWLSMGDPPHELLLDLSRRDDSLAGLLAARIAGDVVGLDRRLNIGERPIRVQAALSLLELLRRDEGGDPSTIAESERRAVAERLRALANGPRAAALRAALVDGLDEPMWIDRCIDALSQVGTPAEVEALQGHASGVLPGPRKAKATRAIQAIQSRVVGAEAGQVSLTEVEGGEVSVAVEPHAAGRLSRSSRREES